MSKAAYSVREIVEMGIASQSHICQMIKACEIPVVKLGHRELIPAWWVEDNFLKPEMQHSYVHLNMRYAVVPSYTVSMTGLPHGAF